MLKKVDKVNRIGTFKNWEPVEKVIFGKSLKLRKWTVGVVKKRRKPNTTQNILANNPTRLPRARIYSYLNCFLNSCT
jgi:hypothetical protein